jgi:hypothetical protein
MQRRAWLEVWIVLLGLAFFWPGYVDAQAAPTDAQTSAGESAEYREMIQQALHEYERTNFNEAKVFFAQAHARFPSARTMRGLGMCAYELRNYVDAIAWFEQALKSAQRPLTPQMRQEIDGLLKQARSFVTRVQITVQPTWAKLRLDTRPVDRDPQGVVLVDPGTHELVVEAPEHDTVARTIRTTGGEQLTVNIALSPLRKFESQAETPAPVVAATSSSEQNVDSNSNSSSIAPWIVVGSSAAVAAAGAVLLIVALNDKATVESPKGQLPTYDRSADERVFPLSVIGITALSLGGAGMIAGLVWNFSSPRELAGNKPTTRVELVPGGARLHASF